MGNSVEKELFSGDYKNTPLWNDTLPEEERIGFLLGELTLEEKFQSLGTGNPEIARLGIPKFGVGGEGAHGVQARHDQQYDTGDTCYTTIFPNPIGMSATWDRELLRQAGDVVAKESRALYHSGRHQCLSLWAPTVDLCRDSRWGRLEECYGEDGYLAGEMAGAYVDGIQGCHGDFLQCAATAKHFYANNMEKGRTYVSSSVDWRNKYEYYLEPFRKLIQEHHLEGVMTAYNEVNGVPCMLLERDLALLKKWGLGHVVCDGGDVGQTVNFHKYFSRHSETIAAGLRAHIDCFTDDIQMVSRAAKEAYQHGMINESELDRALYSYFRVMLRLGFFDGEGKNPYTRISLETVSCEEHRKLARKVTAESVVLLKNESVKVEGQAVLPGEISTGERALLLDRKAGIEKRLCECNRLLPLDVEKFANGKERLAVIGPLCDTWNKGWYSGQPLYGITPWEGIWEAVSAPGEKVSEYGNLVKETGISEVKIKLIAAEGIYLGLLSDGITAGAVPEEKAEIFYLDRWEHDKVTLRAKSNNNFLVLKDDETKGEQGDIVAASQEAFGWFVKEMFHYSERGKEREFTTWDNEKLVLDKGGALRKKKLCAEEGTVSPCWEIEYIKDGIQAAVSAAEWADKVVLCLGAHPMITCKEEIDREDIQLAAYQQEMLHRVAESNSNVILAVLSSVPYDISWAQQRVPAILTMATGSMELGRGLADVLFGKESSSGRLSVTWYHSEKDLPPIDDYDVIQGERTYQYFQGKPLYPFGYGLSYGVFQYSDFYVQQPDKSGIPKEITCSLIVENQGFVCSDEVVQIYARKIDGVVKRGKKVLVYFERLKGMQPGEKRVLHFTVSSAQLRYFDVISGKMLLEPGRYEIQAGASSGDIRQMQIITLQGEERGVRDGKEFISGDCFDTAVNHVLDRGHLSYQAVCTRREGDEVVLTYDRMLLKTAPDTFVMDFWQEYRCSISVEVNGEMAGEFELEAPFATEEIQTGRTKEEEAKQTMQAGEASGEGSWEAHRNWLTRNREIGFREISVPLRRHKIPINELFTLTIRWRGNGKLCMFQFQ